VADKADFNRQVRRTAFMTVALLAALVFGIVVLVGGDWIPGGIIVAATLIGLAKQIPVIRKLCSEGVAPSPPRSKPTS
jgi:hypothetical protein